MNKLEIRNAKTCFDLIIEKDGCVSGLVNVNPLKFLNKLLEDGLSFSIRDSKKELKTKPSFGHKEVRLPSVFNSPFITTKRMYYQCSRGKLYYNLSKQKVHEDETKVKKTRVRLKRTKKLNCPATLTIMELEIYKEFVLQKGGNWRHKKMMLQDLYSKLTSSQNIERLTKWYVNLKLEHNHSIISIELNEQVNEIITAELKRIAFKEKKLELNIVKSLLRHVLRQNGVPPEIIRSSFPNDQTIRYYISKYSFEKETMELDVEAVSTAANEWAQPETVVLRRCSVNGSISEPFEFYYETAWEDAGCETVGSREILEEGGVEIQIRNNPIRTIDEIREQTKQIIDFVDNLTCHNEETEEILSKNLELLKKVSSNLNEYVNMRGTI